jgi:hypothetical protein
LVGRMWGVGMDGAAAPCACSVGPFGMGWKGC